MNYQKHYNELINRAKNRLLETYTENHHIIPKCMNGSNDIENIVALTPEEHYVAHQLLVKIYPGNHKLIYAAHMMTIGGSTHLRNNKLYGWLRKKWNEEIKGNTNAKGYIHTKEARKRMSKSKKGKTWDEIYGIKGAKLKKEKTSNSMKGNKNVLDCKHSKEIKQRQSESMKGEKNPMYGKKHSKESKRKNSNSHKGLNLGSKWINNGMVEKRISSVELEKYLSSGWKLGMNWSGWRNSNPRPRNGNPR